MNDLPVAIILATLVFGIACLLGFVAGNAVELERGADVPEVMELD